jgi:thiamine phosphate synthase YjbQ (UPF0047 family)
MMTTGLWQRLWLARMSRPAGERILYRHVLQARPTRILEVGLGSLVRTERMLRAIAPRPGHEPIRYVGVDRFEGRAASDPPGVSLKEAHRRLHALARVQLVPGNADTSLARVCNHLGTFDLVLVSSDNDPRHIERAWFFLRRFVTAASTVFVDGDARGGAWQAVSLERIDELAARTVQAGLRRAG